MARRKAPAAPKSETVPPWDAFMDRLCCLPDSWCESDFRVLDELHRAYPSDAWLFVLLQHPMSLGHAYQNWTWRDRR